ncbi:MAG TPA: DNA topoisomerase IV subunit B [Geminicoccus sp.]|uniref:DNA topoisomerase IV subunit B n=1 Tax=Geminicoccus sp. TaxID=2024832 RepID=UPI002E328F88|nr:DNA topoisomerase IV subunit B [Geminicoccus sp.]HEX2528292.1 DNA topoisomerase IV subunit B [Geminicoccus sp.]
MSDLFEQRTTDGRGDYTAHDIEVLEGLEPVRRRPGMYIGGTDERALHHLVAEVLDNAMDEAVAGHADRIELVLESATRVTVRDNGRGIPIDPHPKFPDKSALEVILTTLHSGGKFSNKAYQTSGGLHGVGVSVVNALASELIVEVARDRKLYRQIYSRGTPQGAIETVGNAPNRRGTTVTFTPDAEIFGADVAFSPASLHRMARSKAYLFKGVEIRWSCAPELVNGGKTPASENFHFPNGLADFLAAQLEGRERVVDDAFAGEADLPEAAGRIEWAVAWPLDEEGYEGFYCNTIPTPLGGTHEQGLRGALLKGMKAHAERIGAAKRAANLVAEDVQGSAVLMLSAFIPQPQFQGQTKERLVSAQITRPIENRLKDRFETWLASHPAAASRLLDHVFDRADERLARKKQKDVQRKSETRKLRLPGKLADCAREGRDGTEIFLVEGDSAGGSAKQARNRDTQAILPLRGKILNVASATADKLAQNKELIDLVTALGCGSGKHFRSDDLRYDKVVIMTDADVDGAHIAALLMTFFYREMIKLIEQGHLYLAQPPLYRLSHGGKIAYARDDKDKARVLATTFKNKKNVEIGRFKGLGEMNPSQLKETTMDPSKRRMVRVGLADLENKTTSQLVEELMGRKPELRLAFIQENATSVAELDV